MALDRRSTVFAALAIVYVVWGSTYLAIKVAIATLPPFLMASTRFLLAGAVLYAWTARRGEPRATRQQWGAAALAGTLMLVGGNGAVTWAEQRIDSGVAALLVATVPLWIALLAWWRQGERLRPAAIVGLLVGFAGVAALVRPSGHGTDLVAALVVIGGTLAWASGSLYVRKAALPASGLRSTSMQMLAGGAVFAIIGVATGEPAAVDLAGVSLASAAAVLYLAVFGSIVAFTAYTYLLKAAPPSTVATYAYVNPVVAVGLGALVLAEPITGPMLWAGGLIVVGVALIVRSSGAEARRARRAAVPAPDAPAPAVTSARTAKPAVAPHTSTGGPAPACR